MSEFIDDGAFHPDGVLAHTPFSALKGKRALLDITGAHAILGDSGNPHTLAYPDDKLLLATVYGSDDGVIAKTIQVFFDGTIAEAYAWIHRYGHQAPTAVESALDYLLNPNGYKLSEPDVLPRHWKLDFINQLRPKQMQVFPLEGVRFSKRGLLLVAPVAKEKADWRDMFRNPARFVTFADFRNTPLTAFLPHTSSEHEVVEYHVTYKNASEMPPPTCAADPEREIGMGRLGLRDGVPIVVNCWLAPSGSGAVLRKTLDGKAYHLVNLTDQDFRYSPEDWAEKDRELVQALFESPVLSMVVRAVMVKPNTEITKRARSGLQWKHSFYVPGTDAYAEGLYEDCTLVLERGISLRNQPKKLTMEMLALPETSEEVPPLEGVEDNTSPSEGKREWPGFSGLWKRLFG